MSRPWVLYKLFCKLEIVVMIPKWPATLIQYEDNHVRGLNEQQLVEGKKLTQIRIVEKGIALRNSWTLRNNIALRGSYVYPRDDGVDIRCVIQSTPD